MSDKAQITDCLFRRARWLGVIGYDVRRCDFTGADMRGADLRGAFRECNFTGANLVGVHNDPGSRLFRCTFRDAKLRNALLLDAVFDDCVWHGAALEHGSFVGSKFIRTRPTDEQFGDSIMESDIDEATERRIHAEVEAEFRRSARHRPGQRKARAGRAG